MITKTTLKQVIYEQRRKPSGAAVMRQVDRKLTDCPEILVISGVRRCGKSTLLQQIRDTRDERDYCINFDDERLIHFTVDDFQMLSEVFMEEFGRQTTYYLDEIQNIAGWERYVSRLYGGGAKVFVTGSNANLLSRELGTFLTGRHVTHTLYPFSFGEFLTARGVSQDRGMMYTTDGRASLYRLFSEYLHIGGFPQYVFSDNDNYLASLYNDIIYKDVLVRNNLTNERQIKELMYYLTSNVGHRFTFNSLAKQAGIKSADTAKAYVAHIENTYLIGQLNKFDYSLGVQLRSPKKAYCIDNAIINRIGFNATENTGSLLENAVYIELMRRGCELYYYAGKGECDFIIRRGVKVTEAIQVTVTMDDEKTRKRETAGLAEAMRAFALSEGIIITLNDKEETIETDAGRISIMPVWEWILNAEQAR
ncbi:MAG: ATP-binding protein [Prevotella sp.]|jgi:predicted AAA+ superfamily ATPase|nr:ATP-binding protein [Prevotella sp.]